MIVIKRKKNDIKYIIIAIIVIAIIMIGVLSFVINAIIKSTQKGNNTNITANSTNASSEETVDEQTIQLDEIKQLSESGRMKRYIGIV